MQVELSDFQQQLVKRAISVFLDALPTGSTVPAINPLDETISMVRDEGGKLLTLLSQPNDQPPKNSFRTP